MDEIGFSPGKKPFYRKCRASIAMLDFQDYYVITVYHSLFAKNLIQLVVGNICIFRILKVSQGGTRGDFVKRRQKFET